MASLSSFLNRKLSALKPSAAQTLVMPVRDSFFERGNFLSKVSRNAPCPCGSGKKYKKCCGAKEQSHLHGLTAGIRMKGGVCFDEQADVYVPIVHTWDNVHCHGEPTEWRSPKVFATEEEAMKYYKLYIRPDLQRMISKIENGLSDATLVHRKLE